MSCVADTARQSSIATPVSVKERGMEAEAVCLVYTNAYTQFLLESGACDKGESMSNQEPISAAKRRFKYHQAPGAAKRGSMIVYRSE